MTESNENPSFPRTCALEMTLLAQGGPTFPPGIEVHLGRISLGKVASATFPTAQKEARPDGRASFQTLGAYSFSVKLMQPVGQFSTQVPQPVHFMGLTWARQWSMVMAPSGQTLLHLVQPIQPALHTSMTALPRL